MTQPPLRADAEARRVRLLQVAARLFAEEGLDVPMERIAREAGVGVGTLYRRFPDRQGLLIAVVTAGLTRFRDALRRALECEGHVWAELSAAMRQPPETGLGLRGRLAQAPGFAAAFAADPQIQQLQAEVAAALEDVVHAAQQEGSVRTDVGAGDVALLLVALGKGMPRDTPPTGVQRLRALLLDALSAHSAGPLPGQALDIRDIWQQR